MKSRACRRLSPLILLAAYLTMAGTGMSQAQVPADLSPVYCLATYQLDLKYAGAAEGYRIAAKKSEEFLKFAQAATGGEATTQTLVEDLRPRLEANVLSGSLNLRDVVGACDRQWSGAEARSAATASGAYRGVSSGNMSSESLAASTTPGSASALSEDKCAKLDSDGGDLMRSYSSTLQDIAAEAADNALERARMSYDLTKGRLEDILSMAEQYGCYQLKRDIKQALSEFTRP